MTSVTATKPSFYYSLLCPLTSHDDGQKICKVGVAGVCVGGQHTNDKADRHGLTERSGRQCFVFVVKPVQC